MSNNSSKSETAAISLEQAMALAHKGKLDLVEVITIADGYSKANQTDAAVALYRQWLAHNQSPASYLVHFNIGFILANISDRAGSEKAYRQAVTLKPGFVQAQLNLATVIEQQGRHEEALAQWQLALKMTHANTPEEKVFHLHALNNLGRMLENINQFQEAEKMLRQSLTVDPKQPKAMAHLVHLRQKQCEWPAYSPFEAVTMTDMIEGTSALAMLSASNDPQLLLEAARRYVKDIVTTKVEPLSHRAGYGHEKLRIAYLSSDFCAHAVSILTAELFELHDRSRFEVYGFCWSHEDKSPLRARVVAAMDHYIRIVDMNDEQAAQCIRSHEIDILIDLHGLTSGSRPNILAYRAAPVQMTYLGFPGTTAMPDIDYVIADRFVLPEELAPFFTEKPLYMPTVFQVNDRKRAIGQRPTRASCGLPEDAFVFCSFNSNYKFTPEVFSAWMRILQRVPDSVLWLVIDNEWAGENLLKEAEARGVARERLIFAGKVSTPNYLARFQVADLFLDTFPFNAGTTASDALWAGLPLLTCSGRTFCSRMAGSLLQAVGLPELVTSNLKDYEDKAVTLAENRTRISEMKTHLEQNRMSFPLFDSPRFVRELENLFEEVAVQPIRDMQQTPINDIHNVDVFNMMRKNYSKVVEVGSSSGALARVYREVHPPAKYTGIEIVKEYADASRRHCTDVIYGDVEKISDEAFAKLADADCWVFADALEHLYDPWKLLKRIKSSARGSVEVVACMPNAQNWGVQSCLNSGNFVYQDAGLLDRTHIRWFTRITMVELFNSCGFNVVEMTARNFHQARPELIAAIRQMAIATGANPDIAEQDAIPFQYVIRAVSASA